MAGDGTLLRGLPVEGRLPSIDAGDGVGERPAGAIPTRWAPRWWRARCRGRCASGWRAWARAATTAWWSSLSDGPELIFGDASRVRAKWIAAARVLADPDAAGATYIDVRLPDRPAAGGLPGATVDRWLPQAWRARRSRAIPQASGAADPAATTPPTTGVAPASDPAAVALPDPGAAPVATPEPRPAGSPQRGLREPCQTDAGGAGIPAG